MIEFKKGDIWQTECQFIAIPVNCVGAMGAGLADQYRDRDHIGYLEYKAKCLSGEMKVGGILLYGNILFFPTKDHWKNPSKIEYVRDGLDDILEHYLFLRIQSIALPKLGCGHGGLDWKDVRKLIVDRFENHDLNIEVYE